MCRLRANIKEVYVNFNEIGVDIVAKASAPVIINVVNIGILINLKCLLVILSVYHG